LQLPSDKIASVNRQNTISAAIAACSTLAALLAGLLLWQSLSGAAILGCGGGSGCDTVLSSRYSRVGPIPVSALALAIFLSMGFCSLAASSRNKRREAAQRCLLYYTITTATQPASQPSASTGSNQISLYNNRVILDPGNWPLFGSRRGQHLVVLMLTTAAANIRFSSRLVSATARKSPSS
jgi:hypothetical protein